MFSVNSITKGLQKTSITQVRTATKRAAGSRTNKNDSAGRRLGPKVFEGNFVSPGQIIMRQRGTKIHPGENCGIGKDHTIFALEPGFVKFYYDPFHPLRKYVGVALKKDYTLPKDHFDPRLRRFGYVEITDEAEALKEESRMSRKEYLQQAELTKKKQMRAHHDQALSTTFQEQLSQFVELSDDEATLAIERLVNNYKLIRLDHSIEDANQQSTFNYILSLKSLLANNKITQEELTTLKEKYIKLAEKLDRDVTVDFSTKQLTKYLNSEQRSALRNDIKEKLNGFKNKVISSEDKKHIEQLISTPLAFNKVERADLTSDYLPSVLPESVEETVFDPEKGIPEGGKVITKYDNTLRKTIKIGRTKEAFLNQL
ncbi:54S ribosomal protein L2, mitochondrial [[Candida] jaroonii]|uniref:54S ribosomal protein L2, mitochondrial n=1 Tax=[Candida] jaroonii TaxID=467808 RepID=A0ACA9Y5M9_9ASCO|nr:54S ribosomal protein L2, mitochondrial [[Candida] jaroonii]